MAHSSSSSSASSSSSSAPPPSPSLTRLHRDPVAAFEAQDAARGGTLDLQTARRVLQTLGAAPSAFEMASLARTFGDGRRVDYRALVEGFDRAMPPSPALAASARTPASSASAAAPGSAQRRAGSGAGAPDATVSRDSRLLRFESDSLAGPAIFVHGNPALLLAQEGFAAHARRGIGKRDFAASRVARDSAGVRDAAAGLDAGEAAEAASGHAAAARADPIYGLKAGNLQRGIGAFVHGRAEGGGAGGGEEGGNGDEAGEPRAGETAAKAKAVGGKVQHL
jgi:hypothetical protein